MCAQPQTAARQRLVRAGDIDLNLVEYGDRGPTVILIHGIGSDHTSWWPVIDPLAERFHLIAYDQRGHGRSAKPDQGYLIPDYARDLAALIETLDLDEFAVVGHSLGGMVTLVWATRHPRQARRIVIEDSPLRKAENVEELFDGWIALASSSVADAAAQYAKDYPNWSQEDCVRRAQMITSTNLAVFRELRAANLQPGGQDRIAPLSAIESPALLVHGDLETGGMVVPEDAARFAVTLPKAQVVRIPGGSHSLHRDHVEPFLGAVVPFLLEE
jgi:2-(acetamidomethylene)succinate hydrolase